MREDLVVSEVLRVARILLGGGRHVSVKELPLGLRKALQLLGYGRSDIEVVESSSYAVSVSFEGNRAESVTVDLSSGRITDKSLGSWGGSNMFVDRPLDRDERFPVPSGSAVIAGESGGRGKFFRIYVRSSDMSLLISSSGGDVLELSEDERIALSVIGGISSGYRAEEFRRKGLGLYSPENFLIRSLSDKGLVHVMRNGIKITTEGRNYRR